MKTLLIVILSASFGTMVGFFSALFLQELGRVSREEERRHTQPDPWGIVSEPHDKFIDDSNTN